MIDIKEIRKEPQKFKEACKGKGFAVDIDRLLEVEERLRGCKTIWQGILTEKNRLGKTIPKLSESEKKAALAKLSKLKKDEAKLSEEIKKLEPEFDELMLQVPQVPDGEVPFGEDDTRNVEIKRWGRVREFDFEPKDHVQLGLELGIIDIERGVKLAGARNYFLKGDGALLHWAVLRFAMDLMVQKGYVPLAVPILVRDEVMRGTAFFPGGEEQTYQMEKDQLNLAGTAEVPVTAYHSDEILKAEQLPLKYVGLSVCFRREAGAAGKDTHGLYRIHQFDKVEQVIICENSEEVSKKYHQEILANAEQVCQALELPYRVVNVCTGELGRGQVQKFDIEVWMPSRAGYGETHSASIFYEFQARRLNLRYRSQKTEDRRQKEKSQIRFCHTLNNTVIASPRILIPILELNQDSDGSVNIPKALQPYMSGKEKIEG